MSQRVPKAHFSFYPRWFTLKKYECSAVLNHYLFFFHFTTVENTVTNLCLVWSVIKDFFVANPLYDKLGLINVVSTQTCGTQPDIFVTGRCFPIYNNYAAGLWFSRTKNKTKNRE